MKKLEFTVNSWVFGDIPFAELARRAHEIGLDGLEVDGEPDRIDTAEVNRIMAQYNLRPISVCGTFGTPDRAFNHIDPAMRASAVAYGKALVDVAVAIGSDRILLVPSLVGHLEPFGASRQEDWDNAVNAVREVAVYAKEKGNILVMLECVNKYEVGLVYSLADGIQMGKDVGTGNMGLVADTFHMQLEEASGIPSAIRQAGQTWMTHLHLGDNNREVPGLGCRNWREIFQALADIDFNGAVSFEPVPNHLSFEDIRNGLLDIDVLQAQMTDSMAMLKGIMAGIA